MTSKFLMRHVHVLGFCGAVDEIDQAERVM